MHRKDYCDAINKELKKYDIEYDGRGNKLISDDFFDLLMGIDDKHGISRMELAIRRAERNYNQFNHDSPAMEESSTTVFKLVNEIKKYI